MDWRETLRTLFGWPFQLSVCFAAGITLVYFILRWRQVHPWWSLVLLNVIGFSWALYWLGWFAYTGSWFAFGVMLVLCGWFTYKGRDVWTRRETRKLPYP